jgi:hypothetical protein
MFAHTRIVISVVAFAVMVGFELVVHRTLEREALP